MYVQGVDSVYDLNFNGRDGAEQDLLRRRVPAGRAGIFALQFRARRHRDAVPAFQGRREPNAARCCDKGEAGERHLMALPAYDQCIKASHAFNLLDARGVISVTERQSYILRVRELAKACGAAWLKTGGGGAENPSRRHSGTKVGAKRRMRARAAAAPLIRACASRRHPSPASGRRGARPVLVRCTHCREPRMPDLLLELFSEEIPARMQRQAAEDLKRLVTDALVEADVTYEGAQSFATPRRLALHIVGLPEAQPRRREERKGPRVGAPDGAIQGFLKSAGLARIEEAKIEKDAKKGEFYVAVIEQARPRRRANCSPRSCRRSSARFPGRSRCAGARPRREPDALRWVRPLHSILCTFGGPHEAPEIVPFAVDGIDCGRRRPTAIASWRRRRSRCAASTITPPRSPRPRSCSTPTGARRSSSPTPQTSPRPGLELVEDEGLLEEVAGLVEWPVVLMGEFEAAFLDIPPEVIRATIRANQKCFVLRDRQTGASSPTSSSWSRTSSPATAARRSRPATAASCARGSPTRATSGRPTSRRCPTTRTRRQAARPAAGEAARRSASSSTRSSARRASASSASRRWRASSRRRSAPIPISPARAARLAKADLVTEMVGEFPELQGLMGRYYAVAQGEDAERRRRDRGALQAAGAERPHPDRAGLDRRGARRQARHAGRLLGDRREADGQQGPLRAAPRGARRHPHRAGKRAAAAARSSSFERLSSSRRWFAPRRGAKCLHDRRPSRRSRWRLPRHGIATTARRRRSTQQTRID